jgi:hypothetical protein
MVDGLANFTTLNSILHSLPKNDRKSGVMIITRLEEKEASNADPEVIKPVNINKLGEKDSKRLFCHKVFGPDYFHNKVIGGGKSLLSKQEQLQLLEQEKLIQAEKSNHNQVNGNNSPSKSSNEWSGRL